MGSLEKNNLNKSISGFIKVWKSCPVSGKSELIIEQPNLVLYGGASLMAYSLASKPNSGIWGMYIGYNNNQTFVPPTIDVSYSQPFSSFSADRGFGYLREPLTFTPNYLSDAGYKDNTVLFSTMITSSTAAGGAPFLDGISNIYEVALVGAPDPPNSNKDIVFSRTGFNTVRYDNTFNFTITWGIKFLVD
jgi:hypothetical protein